MSVSRTALRTSGSAAGSSGSTTIAGASAAITDMLRDLDEFTDTDLIGLATESLDIKALHQHKINLRNKVSELYRAPNEISSEEWKSNEQTYQMVHAAALCSKAVYKKAVNGHETILRLPNYTFKERHWIEAAKDGSRKTAALFEITPSNPSTRRTLLVFAVRGSTGLVDWLVNFNHSLVPCQDLINLPNSQAKVHRGFAECAKTLAPIALGHIEAALDEIQSQHRDVEIVFTGHSAGGAVASLLFCYFSTFQILDCRQKRLNPPTLSCITFGSPPILTEEIDLLANQGPASNISSSTFLAIVNDGDPIPRMDEAYAKKLASIWHRVGGTKPETVEDLGESVPPALNLNCLGHLVCLRDGNAEFDEEVSLMAYHLSHQELEQRAWANIWAHKMSQYVEWTKLLGSNIS